MANTVPPVNFRAWCPTIADPCADDLGGLLNAFRADANVTPAECYANAGLRHVLSS